MTRDARESNHRLQIKKILIAIAIAHRSVSRSHSPLTAAGYTALLVDEWDRFRGRIDRLKQDVALS